MIVVNIFEAKAKLSEYLDAVGRGERVLICKRNQPVAELRPVESARTEPRPLGLAEGHLTLAASFFKPLPDEMLGDFEGEGPAGRARFHAADGPPGGRSAVGMARKPHRRAAR